MAKKYVMTRADRLEAEKVIARVILEKHPQLTSVYVNRDHYKRKAREHYVLQRFKLEQSVEESEKTKIHNLIMSALNKGKQDFDEYLEKSRKTKPKHEYYVIFCLNIFTLKSKNAQNFIDEKLADKHRSELAALARKVTEEQADEIHTLVAKTTCGDFNSMNNFLETCSPEENDYTHMALLLEAQSGAKELLDEVNQGRWM